MLSPTKEPASKVLGWEAVAVVDKGSAPLEFSAALLLEAIASCPQLHEPQSHRDHQNPIQGEHLQ
jgi:hypothetical protein